MNRRQFLFTSLAGGATASLASAQAPQRPNILFAIADDWSHSDAGAYGCGWVSTPAFDRVAREGVLFNNCFTNNPKCSPCRASILTGRNTWQLEEAMCHFGLFRAKWAVYPDVLEQAGYHVGFTGKGWGPGDYEGGGFKRNPAGPQYSDRKIDPPHRFMGTVDYAGNFQDFLSKRKAGQPFCFWYGAQEPHRAYEEGIGVEAGKDPSKVDLPKFYPDNELIRRDMLDYAVEVEWFDTHLARMLAMLEQAGELDNTLIVVTSDHGMPFPRVKGQIYEHGFHLPLAIRWGATRSGRKVDDFINIRDFAPTFMEAAGTPIAGTMTGRSFLDILRSGDSGWIDKSRNRMLIGKERHDLGRPNNVGYPVRAIRTPQYLYIRNYEPDRWPAGNPETGYGNCDDSPTKSLLTRGFDRYYALSFGKRPAEELFRVDQDPDCMKNLAQDPKSAETKRELAQEMEIMLKADGDPRALGKGAIFDTYNYVGPSKHSWQSWMENQRI